MIDVTEEIKSRLGIVDLVSQYVQLKKAGKNFKGLCPFHSEKSPSFVVSPEKQICHCFGCNKGGDVFSFIQEIEGVTFPEALKVLADKVGIEIDDKKTGAAKVNKSEKDKFFRAHDLALEIFEKELWNSPDGKKVLSYLDRRGVKEETIREFRLGFSPDKFDFLHPKLVKEGIDPDVLLKSGLVASKNVGGGEVYDKYRGRLIFPIFDFLGRVSGFGGRALKDGQMPKYLNSPENIIYNKSKILYGLSHAKKFVKESDQLLLVEGYFDVLLPYQEGVKYVAATSGTALTALQVKQIARLTKKVITCFDADSAGFEATKRAYSLLDDGNFVVKTVSDLQGKDPADAVKDNIEQFKKLVAEADDFLVFFMKKLIEQNDVKDIEGRLSVLKEMLPFMKKLPATSKDFYVRKLADLLKVGVAEMYSELENFQLPSSHPAKRSDSMIISTEKWERESLIIGLLLVNPQLIVSSKKLLGEGFFTDRFKSVYKAMEEHYNASEVFENWDFSMFDSTENPERLKVLALYCDDRYASFSEEVLQEELETLIKHTFVHRKKQRLSVLRSEIQQAESDGDMDLLRQLLTEQQEILSDPA